MNKTFPPPDFVLTESAVPGIEVYMPAPEEAKQLPEVQDFKCPRCGAATAYSVSDGGLRCAHCGYYEPPAQDVVGKGAEEFEFTVETMAAAAHGWGEMRKELQCQNCGARTALPPDRLTHTCPFCGSNRVLHQDAPQDNLRPRFLIPFKVEAEACQSIAQTWLGSSWMTPNSLKETVQVAHFNGIYLPFWTFDAVTGADWRAEVGHTKTETYYVDGKRKTRTKTVWRWESGHARRVFDDVVVPGTSRLSQVLLGRILDYDTQQLVPYEPKYLAGFMAQAHDVQLEDAWARGRDTMRAETRSTCRSQASTSQIRNFSMSLDFSDESWRYILAPVYVAVYTYEGETYRVMLNGQTGTITGQRPVDWTKVWLAIAALLAPGLLLGLAGLITAIFGIGVILLVIAFILLVIGGIITFIILNKAKEMDDV